MKKTIFTLLICLMLFLTACLGQPPAPGDNPIDPAGQITDATAVPAKTSSAQDAAATAGLNTNYTNAVSVELQLLLGTLKLNEADQAITKEQATTLLPLWNNLKSISPSMGPGQRAPGQNQDNTTPQAPTVNTETQTQIDGVVKQILAAMTPAQIKAIADMQITQESSMSIMKDLGISVGGPGQADNSNNGNQPPQGAPPAGADNGGGMQPGNGQGQMKPPAGGGMVPTELFTTLIQTLEKISGTQAFATTTQNVSASTGNSNSIYTITGAYMLDGKTETQTGQTYTASNTDESAIYVTNAGKLTLSTATITTNGETSSADNSSFHGLNAAVLAAGGSSIDLSDSTITTSGSGANGAFATDAGSVVTLSNVKINASGDGGHAVMATNGGTLRLNKVDMNTSGANSGAIATDRGSGTIIATGGIVTTTGQDSPAIYSTGTITVSDAALTASGAEAAVIEGANSISLANSTLSSSVDNKWGVMIYQSFSGDAEGTQGTFTMTGGHLAYISKTGPLFYVNNSTGVINLKGVEITIDSGSLINASANSKWGQSGSNGGNVVLTADGQTLAGDMTADNISTITATLENGSALTGAINTNNSAKKVVLALDASSAWTVTADSYLTCLANPIISGTAIANINSNGHTVFYNASACSALNGQTYSLSGGGSLTPAK